MDLQSYEMCISTFDQYDSIFSSLRENRVHTNSGLFRKVWKNPEKWIRGKTLLITDAEKVVSFISEDQFFGRQSYLDSSYFGLYGVYISPQLRGQGISVKMAKETSRWLGTKKTAVCSHTKAVHLAKYFHHCDIVF